MSAHPGGGFVREALTNGNGVAKRLIVALVLLSTVITGIIIECGLRPRLAVRKSRPPGRLFLSVPPLKITVRTEPGQEGQHQTDPDK